MDAKQHAKAVQTACKAEGLLLLTCSTYDQVIRWIPALTVTAAQVDEALEVFGRAVAGVSE